MVIVGKGFVTRCSDESTIEVDVTKEKIIGATLFRVYLKGTYSSLGYLQIEKIGLLSTCWLGYLEEGREIRCHAPGMQYGSQKDIHPYPTKWTCINIRQLYNTARGTYKGVGALLVQVAYEVARRKFEGRVEVQDASWGSCTFYYSVGFRPRDSEYEEVVELTVQTYKDTGEPGNLSCPMYLPQPAIQDWEKMTVEKPILTKTVDKPCKLSETASS